MRGLKYFILVLTIWLAAGAAAVCADERAPTVIADNASEPEEGVETGAPAEEAGAPVRSEGAAPGAPSDFKLRPAHVVAAIVAVVVLVALILGLALRGRGRSSDALIIESEDREP